MKASQRITLTVFNVVALGLHVFCGAAGYVLARSANPKVPCIAPLFEYQTNAAPGTPFFTPMPKVMFRVGVLLGLQLFAWITAFFHIVYIVQLWTPSFQRWLKDTFGERTVNPIRWLEYSVTAGIMTAFGALDVGLTDFNLFVKFLVNNVVLQMAGLMLEMLNSKNPIELRIGRWIWAQASLLNIANVALMLYQIFASKTHTNVFYYNIVPYALLFNTFGIVAWLNFKQSGFFKSPVYTEMWYIGLSLGTKFSLFWVGYATFRGLQEERGFAPRTANVNWETARICAAVIPISVMAFVAIIEYFRSAEDHPPLRVKSSRIKQEEADVAYTTSAQIYLSWDD